MNLDDMTPVGGGDLRGPAAPSTSKLAGTFSETKITDPAEVWAPRSRDVGVDTSTRYDPYRLPGRESERPMARDYAGADGPLSFHDVGVRTRAAVRPG